MCIFYFNFRKYLNILTATKQLIGNLNSNFMNFNSLQFLCFFPAVCLIYFMIPAVRFRNIFLLAASYYFYMSCQPGYALLLAGVTAIAYISARLMKNVKTNKIAFYSGVILIIATLLIFKYFEFAGSIIRDIMLSAGILIEIPDFSLLLPVGISFFTFQAIGYLIDVKRGTIEAEGNLIDFSLYMAFFPQLVAGPIERCADMLPQFRKKQDFDYIRFLDGLIIMLCGYFLKLVLADRCGEYVDAVYNNIGEHNGGSALLASFLFSFQILGDFAGYSLIALGAAKIMGFRLTRNFDSPYLSASVGEFWRRWHISLSRWLRDYVYIPLGGNRKGKGRTYTSLLTTFLISGLWHGASWSFILWGGLHGSAVCLERTGSHLSKKYPVWRPLGIITTFLFVTFAWIFFRAPDISSAFEIIRLIVFDFDKPYLPIASIAICAAAILSLPLITVIERQLNESIIAEGKASVAGYRAIRLTAFSFPVIGRQLLIAFLGAAVILFGSPGNSSFIYFQF